MKNRLIGIYIVGISTNECVFFSFVPLIKMYFMKKLNMLVKEFYV